MSFLHVHLKSYFKFNQVYRWRNRPRFIGDLFSCPIPLQLDGGPTGVFVKYVCVVVKRLCARQVTTIC